jgi:hypothetical protein
MNLLFCDYQVGSGGFASVFSALFIFNRKWVAVKEIKKNELLRHRSGLDMLSNVSNNFFNIISPGNRN